MPHSSPARHAALPPARDALAVSRDLADEALVEAGALGAVPILAGGPPDLPGVAFESHQEQPLDPSRVEVVHRLRLAVGRAADDRDAVGHLRRLAHRAEDDELAEALDLRLHGDLHRRFHRDLSFAVPFADQLLELLHRRSPFRGSRSHSETRPAARTIGPATAQPSAPRRASASASSSSMLRPCCQHRSASSALSCARASAAGSPSSMPPKPGGGPPPIRSRKDSAAPNNINASWGRRSHTARKAKSRHASPIPVALPASRNNASASSAADRASPGRPARPRAKESQIRSNAS